MTKIMQNSTEVDLDSLVESLRTLADGIDDGRVLIQRIEYGVESATGEDVDVEFAVEFNITEDLSDELLPMYHFLDE